MYTMIDNSDVTEAQDGQIVDRRIENLLSYTLAGKINHPDYDSLLNEVLREFLHSDMPLFYASKTQSHDATVISYIVGCGMECSITVPGSANWPGEFSYAPDFPVAVAVYPRHEDEACCYFPGRNLNLAALGALVQVARQKCDIRNNQRELPLN